jgi:hypothetical protein
MLLSPPPLPLARGSHTCALHCPAGISRAPRRLLRWASGSCSVGVFTWLLSLPPTSVDTNLLTTNEVHAFIIALVALCAHSGFKCP